MRSSTGAGTTFEVFWPAVARVRDGGAHVLIVDDEAMVRDVVCRMLSDVGYRTCAAADGWMPSSEMKSPNGFVGCVRSGSTGI